MGIDNVPGAEPPLYFLCYSRSQRGLVEKIEAKLAAQRRRGELDMWRDVRNLDTWKSSLPKSCAFYSAGRVRLCWSVTNGINRTTSRRTNDRP